eukprot:scaffold1010_cov232-Chaetoceros_neogracile.AAC.6
MKEHVNSTYLIRILPMLWCASWLFILRIPRINVSSIRLSLIGSLIEAYRSIKRKHQHLSVSSASATN